jgi:hypothetical protein
MKLSLGLSESPASVLAELYPRNAADKELSLEEFIAVLPETIDQSKNSTTPDDPVGNLMEYVVIMMCMNVAL